MTMKKSGPPTPRSVSRSPLVAMIVHDGTRTEARIEEAHIVWAPPNRPPTDEVATAPPERLVYDFAGLANRSDDQLLRFANKYGPLRLCKHGFALGHRQRNFNLRCYESDTGQPEDLPSGTFFRLKWSARESIEAWRRYIGRAAGILSVSDRLHEGQRATQDEWAWLLDGIPAGDHEYPFRALLAMRKEDVLASNPLIATLAAQPHLTLPQQRRTLAVAVNHWLDECGVGISINWRPSGIDFSLGPSNPFGLGNSGLLAAIGVQLLSGVLRQTRMVWCSDCGKAYPPERWPRDGENHFCPDCGTKAANRIAAREYRKRRKSKSK
jgi:hypothetical protein